MWDPLLLAGLGCFLLSCLGLDHPPQKIVRVGDGLSIPCPLTGPGASVQWLQNGAPVLLDGSPLTRRRQWSVSKEGVASLAISVARRSDAGRWECRELGPDGTVRRTAAVLDLVVGSPPSDPYLELEGVRLVHQATLTAREPQQLTLHCIVEGAVPPVRSIHWTLGDSNVTESSELFVEFSGEAYTSRSVLTLNATRAGHGREVVCRVHHVTWLQTAAVSASLNVLYEPSFSIGRDPGFGLPLMQGMRVSLRCDVDANPPSEPLWVRDDGPLSIHQDHLGHLNFTPINQDHSGWYRCTTQHQFGFFASFGYFLNVRGAELPVPSVEAHIPEAQGPPVSFGCIPDGRPEVTAVNRSLIGLSGGPALLSAQICSNPAPIRVFWVLRHLVLRPGEKRHPYRAQNLTETDIPNCWMCGLELLHLSMEDSGEVLLVAKNTAGTTDALFLVNVTRAASSYSSSATGLLCALLVLLFPVCLAWMQKFIDTS